MIKCPLSVKEYTEGVLFSFKCSFNSLNKLMKSTLSRLTRLIGVLSGGVVENPLTSHFANTYQPISPIPSRGKR